MRRLLTASLLILTGAVASGLAAPRLHGQAVRVPDQPTVKFDVTSVKPNDSGDDSVARIESPSGFNITNATLQMMMRWAYRVQDFQIIDGPSWLTTARFDVVGKAETSVSDEDRRLMLRALLLDRFMLVVHNETRELPIYALVAAKKDGQLGPQLRKSSDCATPLEQQSARPEDRARTASPPTCWPKVFPGNMSVREGTMLGLTVNLSVFTGRTVVDRTGLAGTFDYDLTWTPELAADPSRPSLFTALQEQLGLKLESTKGPVDVLVIDHIEKPTPD